MKIVYFGFSADPPHLGHLMFAEAVYRLGYDRVWWMITPQNPRKSWAAMPYFHRRELARLLIGGRHEWLEVCDFEAGMAPVGEGAWTYTTLAKLKAVMPEVEITFVLGADNWVNEKGFVTWERVEDIFPLASVLVLPRDPHTEKVRDCAAFRAFADREDPVGEGPVSPGCWRMGHWVETHAAQSTEIRRELRMGQRSEHLTDAQNDYIWRHRLYGCGD